METIVSSPLMDKTRLSPRGATIIVIALFGGYTVLQVLYLIIPGATIEKEIINTALAPLFGIFGILTLFAAGYSRQDCFLTYAPISKKGALALLASSLALVIMMPFGRWIGWNWFMGLVSAPSSGISQELFFRATLLPLLLRAFPQKPWRALEIHAVMFGIWHMGVLWLAPIGPAILVMVVPLACGVAWGWQVQHDQTILYTIILHSVLLIINSMFTY